MLFKKKIASLLTLGLFIVFGVFAQQDSKVTDKEIEQFASAMQEISVINNQIQQEMVKAVEDEGMEVQRYNEILQKQQNPTEDPDLNGDEKKKFDNINLELQEIQVDAQKKMEEIIVEEGLTLNRYQEIASLVQSDPELQKKVQEHFEPAG